MQSLLETYGIPSTLSCDVPNLVYPNNVGEVRVSVPPALEDQAFSILAEQRRIAPLMAAALASDANASARTNGVFAPGSPVFPMPVPLAVPFSEEEEEEEEEDDDDDDGGDEEGDVQMDDEDLAGGDDEEDEDEDDDDDDLFDDEE